MKTPLILLLFCFFALAAKADAANQSEPAPLKSKGDRVTINDESVKIMEVGSDYILGLSASGVATIKRKSLAPEVEGQINWPAPTPRPKKELSPQEIADEAARQQTSQRITRHEVWIGMSLEEAKQSRGKPTSSSKGADTFGTDEAWFYENAQTGKTVVFFFMDGRLNRVQEN